MEAFEAVLLNAAKNDSRRLLLDTNEIIYAKSVLEGTAGGTAAGAGARQGATTRRAGGRRVQPAKACKSKTIKELLPTSFIKESFMLQAKSDGTTVLCRKSSRRSTAGSFPIIAIDELEARLEQDHLALGHPGYEVLHDHVRVWCWDAGLHSGGWQHDLSAPACTHRLARILTPPPHPLPVCRCPRRSRPTWVWTLMATACSWRAWQASPARL